MPASTPGSPLPATDPPLSAASAAARRWRDLSGTWEMAGTAPGAASGPDGITGLGWVQATVPGTAAGALRAAGAPEPADLDSMDWWFRTRFHRPVGPGESATLHAGGLATVAEVYLNGTQVLTSESMFAWHAVAVDRWLQDDNELAICFRALAPLLAVRRRPRARWRTRLVANGNLRFYRTMLLGRAPGFAPGPPVVGPWGPIRLSCRGGPALEDLTLRAGLRGDDGVVQVTTTVDRLPDRGAVEVAVEVDGPTGRWREVLTDVERDQDRLTASGELTVTGPALWWPHTHGEPERYMVTATLSVDGAVLDTAARSIGFRTLTAGEDIEHDGLQLRVNDVPVFARGAVWTPSELAAPAPDPATIRARLQAVCDAGMNMLRIPGTACYEGETFHDLCDELGLLVWQDFMFANLDYPESDADFMRAVELEARQVLRRIAWRPSLAVVCGGSEVAQQVAMLGLDVRPAEGPLYGDLLPALVAESGTDAVYVPSTPWGGALPFRPDRGVANYYGVGAYLRPLEDARRSEVKFAAECLAFANVPDGTPDEPVGSGGLGPQDPAWKLGVPRDVGAGWDFEDVRDHYLAELFGVEPARVRAVDIDRYLELSRATTAEVMAEVFGEWRRRQSPCGGALVLWLTDLLPGAGWGLMDHRGRPKLVYHHLRRALAPVAVWSSDEGLGGVVAHVANDGPDPLEATLRVALYRSSELRVAEARVKLRLEPHSGSEHNVEELVGRFVDASWSYRFGPPAQDLIVFSLERPDDGEGRPLSQTIRFPAGRPAATETATALGLSADVAREPDGGWGLRLCARRLVYGCRITLPGFVPEDDGFSLEPGYTRDVRLTTLDPDAKPAGALTAINLDGQVPLAPEAGT